MAANLDMAMQVLGYYEWSSVIDPPAENVPGDQGGWTKYGIAQASHPEVDVQNLTLEQATLIYKSGYWVPFKCDQLNDQILATQLFLGVVNTSQRATVQCLQAAINQGNPAAPQIATDGAMGPATVAAANALVGLQLRSAQAAFSSAMSNHYRLLNQPKFLNGWLTRARWPFLYTRAWPYIDENWRPI